MSKFENFKFNHTTASTVQPVMRKGLVMPRANSLIDCTPKNPTSRRPRPSIEKSGERKTFYV